MWWTPHPCLFVKNAPFGVSLATVAVVGCMKLCAVPLSCPAPLRVVGLTLRVILDGLPLLPRTARRAILALGNVQPGRTFLLERQPNAPAPRTSPMTWLRPWTLLLYLCRRLLNDELDGPPPSLLSRRPVLSSRVLSATMVLSAPRNMLQMCSVTASLLLALCMNLLSRT